MDDHQLDFRCEMWVVWCHTKGIMAPRTKGNVLGRFQPGKVGKEPDAELSQELAFFNMAIHALAENNPKSKDLECFVGIWVSGQQRKAIAIDQKCAESTVTYRARRFAREAVKTGKILRRYHTGEFYQPKREEVIVD